MGRRKIEIKAIKDDRNRSVTFLKRKGGLFKKAHELSVLCSVDVAVIVFGQNKKLYEFSSGNIHDTLWRHQQYAGPHEHKGPNDFVDKGDNDDEDEDEENMGSPLPDEPSPPHHGVVAQQYANHPGVQHMRHVTPSQSPPIQNGMYAQRMSTPQPQNLSRPSSRNTHGRRPSSNLVPQNHPQPQAQQAFPQHMGYSNPSNAQYYQHMQPATSNVQMNGVQGHPQMAAQHHQYPHQMPPQQNQMQQVYMQEARRQSLPSTLPPQQQQQQHQERMAQGIPFQSPPLFQRPFQSPPLPEPKPGQTDARMQRAQKASQDESQYTDHMRQETNHLEDQRNHVNGKAEQTPRAQSIDVGSALRHREDGARETFQPPSHAPAQPARSDSSSTANFPQPSRVNSISSEAKRPRLKVQIPSEQSDGGSGTGESSPKESGAAITPTRRTTTDSGHSPSVVLPPPSPSASAILSAGASGPKNPFARPPPPNSALPSSDRHKDTETPISALPSRFVSDGLLPSPSSFYPEWGFGHVGSANPNNLASPAPYQPTPINTHGPSWRDEEPDKKRKSPDTAEESVQKKIKT